MLSDWPHEGQALVTVIVCLAAAYLIIYPALNPRTMNQMALYDLGITGVMLLINGLLFAGAGLAFSMVFFATNWVIYTFLTAVILEVPLAWWYARRNGISFDPGASDQKVDKGQDDENRDG